MLTTVVLGLSAVLPFAAAILALNLIRMIRLTMRRWAWVAIASALTLMGIQRSIAFFHAVLSDAPMPVDIAAEIVALCISLFLVIGVVLVTPAVRRTQRTHAVLRESEERFRAIVDNSLDGITIKGADGRFLFANGTYAAWANIDPENIVGKTSFDIFPEEQAASINETDRQVIADRRISVDEVKRTFPDGVTRSLLNHKMPVELASAETPAVVTIMTDLTKSRETEDALHQAQKLEAVGRLTGGVAHDFNNLLGIIQGNLELLALEGRNGQLNASRLDRFTRPALAATKSGAALIQRLLAFSRKQTLQFEPVDVHQLVGGMYDLLQRSLGETIEIHIEEEPGTWMAYADSNQVENAILNLAINSRDAMPDGGTLTVKTKNITLTDADANALRGARSGDYVALTVTDTGTGMLPDVIEQAFEPFFTTKDVGQGSGLGLSMIYGFAQQSGGFTTIESEPGKGAAITLYLPKAEPNPQTETTRESATDLSMGRGETILLIEDDDDVRAVVTTMLERLDYTVLTAASGAAALEIQSSHGPVDILLSDLILPGGMNGAEAFKQLRAGQADLKCILMSGYSSPSVDKSLPEGTAILDKPVEYGVLADTLRRKLDG